MNWLLFWVCQCRRFGVGGYGIRFRWGICRISRYERGFHCRSFELSSLRRANQNLLAILESGQAMDGVNFDVLMRRMADNSLKIKTLSAEYQMIESTRREVVSFSDDELQWRCAFLRDLILASEISQKRCWLKSFVREIRVGYETLEVVYSENLLVNSSGNGMFRFVEGENGEVLPYVSTWRKFFIHMK